MGSPSIAAVKSKYQLRRSLRFVRAWHLDCMISKKSYFPAKSFRAGKLDSTCVHWAIFSKYKPAPPSLAFTSWSASNRRFLCGPRGCCLFLPLLNVSHECSQWRRAAREVWNPGYSHTRVPAFAITMATPLSPSKTKMLPPFMTLLLLTGALNC